MEYSVSHVSAQLAGAEDGKRRRQCAAAVLALPSGCLRAGAWVRWGNLDAPASFSEPVEVVAEVPKPDSPLPPISPLSWQDTLVLLHSSWELLWLKEEPGNDSMILLRLLSSSLKSHSRETEPTTPVMEMIGGGSFWLSCMSSLALNVQLEQCGPVWRGPAQAQRTGCTTRTPALGSVTHSAFGVQASHSGRIYTM